VQLVINTFGTHLRRRGDRFVVKARDKELAVSAHNHPKDSTEQCPYLLLL
jgi:hypothetical protein